MTASKEFYRRRALRDAEEAFAPTAYQERMERERESRWNEYLKKQEAERKRREEEAAREEQERQEARARLERESQEAFNAQVESYIDRRRAQLSLMIGGEALERRLEREREDYIERVISGNEAKAREDAIAIAKGESGGSGGRLVEFESYPVDS